VGAETEIGEGEDARDGQTRARQPFDRPRPLEVHEHRRADHLAAGRAHRPACLDQRPPGADDVVDQDDPRPPGDGRTLDQLAQAVGLRGPPYDETGHLSPLRRGLEEESGRERIGRHGEPSDGVRLEGTCFAPQQARGTADVVAAQDQLAAVERPRHRPAVAVDPLAELERDVQEPLPELTPAVVLVRRAHRLGDHRRFAVRPFTSAIARWLA
jgi:hypothetical protein